MHKKLKLFVCLIPLIFLSHNISVSEESVIIPIKKPALTEQELKKKVSINLLKPLSKPVTINKKIVTKEINKIEDIKPKYLVPKKKPLIAGNKKAKEIKILFIIIF